MSAHSAGLVLALLLAAAAGASPGLCGVWSMPESAGWTAVWDFSGATAGTYTLHQQHTVVGAATGSAPAMAVAQTGAFRVRLAGQLVLVAASTVVTPGSAAMAAELTAACPCNGTWAALGARELAECPEATCMDTALLGLSAKYYPVVIGSPMYVGQQMK